MNPPNNAVVPMTAQGLCDQCRNVNLRHYLSPQNHRFLWGSLPNAISLSQAIPSTSSTSTCALCRTLAWSIQHIPDAHISVVQFEIHGTGQTLEGHDTEIYFMRASVPSALRIAPLASDSFRLAAQRHSYGRLVQIDRLDRHLVARWLQDCEETHERCSVITHAAVHDIPVPQYVVDVVDMKIKEVKAEKIRYLALSYVWGDTQSLQLLNTNVAHLMISHSLQSHLTHLSKVVKNAITFTREIGERFLWVDALCICQDDPSTKHGQISAMNAIYANAAMTLVGLEGDASYGLPGVEPYPIPRHQPIETVHGIRIMTLMPDINEVVVGSAWRTRAWTYQEEQFSRRLLFFSDQQAYFRCQAATHCEDRYEESKMTVMMQQGTVRMRLPIDNSPFLSFAFSMWRHLVENFSTREFTFDIDRYNAFAGLESELAVYMEYPCIVGMPIENLVQQLYWNHDNILSNRVRRIPGYSSWSWCGWTGGVAFPRINIRNNITAIELSKGTLLTYDKKGTLVKEDKPPDAPPLIMDLEDTKSLIFSPYSTELSLDTSQHATNGLILITPKPGKVCGIIQAQHLSSSMVADLNSTGQCIMMGSCDISVLVEPCDFAPLGASAVQDWFRLPNQSQPKRPSSITYAAAHEPRSLPGGAMQRIRRTSTWQPPVLHDAHAPKKGTWWISALRCLLIFSILAPCNSALIIHMGMSILGGIILGPYIVLVTMLVAYACGVMFNELIRKRKWQFLGGQTPDDWVRLLVEDYVVASLSLKWQTWFEKVFNTLVRDVETGELVVPTPSLKVANLMLIAKSEDEDGVYHRLGIGAMSATCWEECEPVRRRIVLK
jgi:hypothetical protein